jgi:hypothetical protein
VENVAGDFAATEKPEAAARSTTSAAPPGLGERTLAVMAESRVGLEPRYSVPFGDASLADIGELGRISAWPAIDLREVFAGPSLSYYGILATRDV